MKNLIKYHKGVFFVEEWKDIEGYEGVYQISSFGRVKSLPRKWVKKESIRATYPNIDGYLIVCLSINQKRETRSVHRMVAKYFIPNPNNLPEVNHIKGVKTDCRVFMLEWSSKSNNMLHSYRELGRKPPRSQVGVLGILNKRAKKINQLDPITNKIINTFYGFHEAERITGISATKICAVARGSRNATGDYKWEYAK